MIGPGIPGTTLKVSAQFINIGTNDAVRIWPPRERISDSLHVCLPGRLVQRGGQGSAAAPEKINRGAEPPQIFHAPLVELASALLGWRPNQHEPGNYRYRDNRNGH